jgi:hypothetical protein
LEQAAINSTAAGSSGRAERRKIIERNQKSCKRDLKYFLKTYGITIREISYGKF